MASTSFKVVGLKGLSAACKEFSQKISKDIPERTITYSARQTYSKLMTDTPVKTGRLRASTEIRKESPTKQTIGQSAPYAKIVNDRLGYWDGATTEIAEQWPSYVTSEIKKEWDIVVRKYSGK